MYKKIIILLLLPVLLFSCSKNKSKEIVVEPDEKEIAVIIYNEALQALKDGDSFYAAKKFREVETLMPQSKWAAKSSLMASYADYSRNSYSNAIFGLERHNYDTSPMYKYNCMFAFIKRFSSIRSKNFFIIYF